MSNPFYRAVCYVVINVESKERLTPLGYTLQDCKDYISQLPHTGDHYEILKRTYSRPVACKGR